MFDNRRIRLLEAMGYQMLVRVASADAADMTASQRVQTALPSVTTTQPGLPAAPRIQVPPPSAPVVPVTPIARTAPPPSRAAPTVPLAAATPATGPDRLWQALLAAAAMAPERADANGLRRASSGVAVEYIRDELWVDPAALRASPRDKRGLWKTLRALRRAELARQA